MTTRVRLTIGLIAGAMGLIGYAVAIAPETAALPHPPTAASRGVAPARAPATVRTARECALVFADGEELVYRASYLHIPLATIRYAITGRFEREGRDRYLVRIRVDADRAIRWMSDVDRIFEGEVDAEAFAHAWASSESAPGGVERTELTFDYPHEQLLVTRTLRDARGDSVRTRIDTAALRERGQSGVSLLYYIRTRARIPIAEPVPTYFGARRLTTQIHAPREHTRVHLRRVDYPVDVVHLTGMADYVGVYGTGGKYDVWLSNDDACVPVMVRLKAFIGTVKIDLVEWRRGEWMPPRALPDPTGR